jgi:phosphate transport system permease protein
MRTLSANIAVELPEAPHGGTLYRTLFLGAFVLFVLTFFVNTVAETLRHRLRDKYKVIN